MNKSIGFIGIGNMGFGMVTNLIKRGFTVFVYDIDDTKLEAAERIGAIRTKNVLEIGDKCRRFVIALPRPEISAKVLFGQGGIANGKKTKLVIETSTLSPDDAVLFEQKLKLRGINYLGAPMLAGKQMALEGRIQFIVEGDNHIFQTNTDIFEAMGRSVYIGKTPSATIVKLVYNLCRYSTVATAIEALQLLKTYSADTRLAYTILVKGSLDNFGQVWKEEMDDVAQGKPYKFAGSKIPEKDLALLIELAKKKNLSTKLMGEVWAKYRSLKR